MMPLYRRKWPCAICHKPVIWDSDKKEMSCGCKTERCTFVNLDAFELLPKFDKKFWEGINLPIDSAKFLLSTEVLFISDRESIFEGNENPQINVRWIKYPEKNKTQVCIEVQGNFHTEKISYNRKDPSEWKGRMWIYLPREIIPKLIEYLQKDPHKLEAYM